ncbi:hypothetical protein AB0H76_19470 [Nocardia sp. NPDC050712]|uniref:hypothetical protein n=1 Tax=Nocardia sp. NPDC050712 TaxID=3155518 RepID=UPI0033D48F88
MVLDTDDDLVLLWMVHFRDRHAGYHRTLVSQGAADEFAAPARAVRAAHAARAATSFVQSWRHQREAFLDAEGN